MRHLTENKGKAFRWKYWLMDLHRFFCWLIFMPGYRLKTHYIGERFKLDGGGILACNHRGFGDGIILFLAFWWRRVFYMVAEAAMNNWFKKALMSVIGCIRIDRNIVDIETMHRCTSMLNEGHVVGVFPQGKIVRTGEIDDGAGLKMGTVLMAIQSGVPIIPMYHQKRKSVFHRWKIVIGQPIYCKDWIKGEKASMKEMIFLTNLLQEKMNECKDVYEQLYGRKAS